MADRTSMSVIPVAKSTVTEIEVIAIASDVKVAVAQEIASEDDEGVDLAIASDHAVLEVVLVQAAAATVQDHVIAKGQKDRDQKIVIEADEIGIEARMQIRMNGVKLGLRTNLRTEMITMVKMTTLMAMDTMLKSRLSRKIVSLLATPMKTEEEMATGIELKTFSFFLMINKQIICFSSSTKSQLSFNIASEASYVYIFTLSENLKFCPKKSIYVYILSGQKFIKMVN